MLWLDDYERRARLVPGLLAVLPVAVVVVALGLRENPVVALVGGVLSAIGGPVILAGFVRQRGLALQDALFKSWDGAPTTRSLRHRGDSATAPDRKKLRSHVETILDTPLATATQEASDPVRADAGYEQAVARVVGQTRDAKRFPLLYAENKNYGYERNMLAMKPAGLIIDGVAGAALVAGLFVNRVRTDSIVGLIVVAGIAVVWLVVPRSERVRRVAEAYARRWQEAAWGLTAKP